MKIKVSSKKGDKKYEYDYRIIYTNEETHKRMKEYSSERRITITEGLKELLDFYEEKGNCRCIQN